MTPLSKALSKHRKKEEVFQPIWDKNADNGRAGRSIRGCSIGRGAWLHGRGVRSAGASLPSRNHPFHPGTLRRPRSGRPTMSIVSPPNTALALLLCTGFYPLWFAWRANQRTTPASCNPLGRLRLGRVDRRRISRIRRTPIEIPGAVPDGCAGVAVLGARRPGMTAWNFVVAGLLAVLLLPVARDWAIRV